MPDFPKMGKLKEQPDGSLKIMKHTGPFKKHKGASLKADFAVQKVHSNGKKKKRS